MTVFKRVLSVFCAVCIALLAEMGLFCNAVAADEVFKITNGRLEKYTGTASDVVVPDGVTEIVSNAFSGNKTLRSVVIPEGVTKIGNAAFSGCTALSSVTLPNTLTVIDKWAFNSTALETVALPFSLCKVEFAAFANSETANSNSLKKVYVKNKYTAFGESVFDHREGITVYAPADSVAKEYASSKNISWSEYNPDIPVAEFNIEGDILISAKNAVGNIVIPDGVKKIEDNAFKGNAALYSVTVPYGVETIGDSAFADCVNLRSVTLPESLITISNWAFMSTNLSEGIIIPHFVQSVGFGAFLNFLSFNNETMKDIYFYNSQTAIGQHAFDHRAGLTVHSAADSTAESYVKAVLNEPEKEENKDQTGITFKKCEIPELVPKYTVDSNGVLTAAENVGGSITLPDTVKEIAPNVFKGNKSITSVTFCEGVKKIGGSAFAECGGLISVNLPYTLEEIGDWAFYGTRLKALTLPNRTVYVGDYAFACPDGASYAEELDAVNIFNEKIRFGTEVFRGRSGLTLKSSDASSAKNYANQCGFNYEIISIPPEPVQPLDEGVHNFTVENGVLTAYSGTGKRVTIPESLKIREIAPNAFKDNKDIIEVIIPEGVIKIGDSAFSYCENLRSVSLPQSLYTIDPFAFCGTAINEIILKHKVSKVGAGAFSFIDSAVLAISVYNPECVFEGEICSSPNKNYLRTIMGASGSAAQSYASSYEYIDFREISVPEEPQIVYEEGVHKFYVQDGLLYKYEGTGKKVTIPADLGICGIADNAFKDNLDIQEVILPYGVEKIGDSSFSGCKNLKRVSFPPEMTEIGPFAFCGTGLESVIIPHDVTKIGVGAFAFIDSPALKISIYNTGCNIENNDICSVSDSSFKRIIMGASGSTAQSFADTKDYCEFRAITIPPREDVEIEEGVHKFTVKDGVLVKYEGTGKKVTVPSTLGIKEIGPNAFKDQTQILQVILPEGIVKIGDSAFSGCTSLRKITLPSTLNEIVQWAFCATSIKYAEIPKSCKTVGIGAFGFSRASSTTIAFFNPKTRIGADLCTSVRDDYSVTLMGYSGSTAERYAAKYKYNFVSLDSIAQTGESNTPFLIFTVLIVSVAGLIISKKKLINIQA